MKSLCLILVVISFFIASSHLEAQDQGALLETIGATSAQGLFLTHMAIGTLADSYAKKAYNKQEALQIVDAYIQITQATKDKLNELLTTQSLSEEDTKGLRKIISIYDTLLASAQDVKAFINTGNKSHADAYTRDRDKAWKQISNLLGIK